ncbi:MAG: hypothetical protein RLZZ157_1271 [Pseudomonadota bacterium]|jgi:flagellin
MIGVNTNRGSMVALQSLSASNRSLSTTQNAISTGLRVANSKDNGAIWAIANRMGSDVSAYNRVLESTDTAIARVDLAISGAESIMEILNELKGKALAASQPGLSTAAANALNADFVQLRDQISSIVATAQMGNGSMISSNNGALHAVALGDSNGGNSILVNAVSINLGSGVVPLSATSDVLTNATATLALGQINTSINNLGSQLSTWGAGSKRLAMHRQFITKLQDAISDGKGELVDADIEKESAKLQAYQVKVQLGTQALSIANSAPQTALALFKN